jgi:hypothetical protein
MKREDRTGKHKTRDKTRVEHGKTGQRINTRQDKTKTRQDKTSKAKTRQDKIRQNKTR